MKQFTEKEKIAITETAEMIYNFKIGNSIENLKGTLESFVLCIKVKEKPRNRLIGFLSEFCTRDWVKAKLNLHDIDDLQIGGHCGLCGHWIPDIIIEKAWSWSICKICLEEVD